MDKKEILKESLFNIFEIDLIVNKFHNKVTFMNLNHYMQRAHSWDEEKLALIHENLVEVRRILENVSLTVDELNEPVQSLIESYAWEKTTDHP